MLLIQAATQPLTDIQYTRQGCIENISSTQPCHLKKYYIKITNFFDSYTLQRYRCKGLSVHNFTLIVAIFVETLAVLVHGTQAHTHT